MQTLETVLSDYFNALKNSMRSMPLNLGGIGASGGGVGGPPGGFIGKLPQTKITYDMSELATDYTPLSGYTLVDNLNHIRYRLQTLEASGIPSSGGVGRIDIAEDDIIIASGVSVLNFEGDVDVTATESGVTITLPMEITENLTSQVTGSGTIFTLLNEFISDSTFVTKNGLKQIKDVSYTEYPVSKYIEFTEAPSNVGFTDIIEVIYKATGTITPVSAPSVTLNGTVSTGTNLNSQSINTFSHTVNVGNNQILLVGWSGLNSATIVNSITYNGTALTKIGAIGGGTIGRSELWYLLNPTAGTYDIVITQSANAYCEFGAITFKNVNQTTPYTDVTTATTTNTVTVDSKDGSVILGLLSFWGGASTDNSSNQSTLYNLTSDGSWRGHCSYKPGETSSDLTWTCTTTYAAILALSLDKEE